MQKIETIHLFFTPRQDKNAFWRANQKLEQKENLIVVTHKQQLPLLLTLLPLNQKVIFWVHISTFQVDASKYPLNLGLADSLKAEGLISQKTVVNFFTTGGIDTNIKGDTNVSINPYLKIANGHPIYTLNVLGKDPEKKKYQPKPQTIREISQEPFRAVNHFNYEDTKSNSILIYQIRTSVDEQDLKEILGTCFPEEARNFFILPIGGGYSGAVTFKVEYEINQKTVSSLLKIDRKNTDLINEYRFGKLKQLKQLGSNFINPYPSNIKKVNDWYCLVFPYCIGANTLGSFIADHLHDESINLHAVMEDVLEKFSEFERKLSQPTFYKLKPWSGTINDDVTYSGLNIKESHKINLLHVILKAIINIPQEVLIKCNLDKDNINALINFIQSFEDCKFKNKSIDAYDDSLFQKVPLAIVHGDLHLRNILINSSHHVTFIDFANVSSTGMMHAFRDMGKLSSDLEVSILDFDLNEWESLTEALAYHRSWMRGVKTTSKNKKLQKIYELNSQIRTNILVKYSDKMKKEEILHQFYLTRLHYFLKAISYNQAKRETLIFLIGLCIDILNILTTEQ